MARLVIAVLVEVVAGLMVAAGILAALVPALLHRGLISTGDARGGAVVGLVIVACVGAAVARPGSALRRRSKR